MKKAKVLLSAFAVLAIVASALAFKASAYFGSGSVYCTSTCPVASKIDFRIDPAGTNTIPCGATVQPFVLTDNNTCVAVTPFKGTTPTLFTSTALGK